MGKVVALFPKNTRHRARSQKLACYTGAMLRIYRIFRDVLTWLLGGIILAIVGEFAIDLAREHGLFDRPTERVEAVISLLRTIRSQFWFSPAAAWLAGLVFGMWMDAAVLRSIKRRFRDDWEPASENVNPLETYFSKKVLRVVDLPAENRFLVEDKFFEDCILQGPGVIAFLETVSLEYCSFEGDQEKTFIEVEERRKMMGVIGFRRCRFLRCKFVGLGIVGSKKDIDHMRSVVQRV
jgi:hypothetical protein